MKIRILLAVLTVILGAGLVGLGGKDSPPPAPVRAALVRLAPVVYSDVPVPVRVSGVLARRAEADLSFKIGGVIESVGVRAGDTVQAGQELARLRLDEINAQVAQARSGWEKAQRDLGRVEKLAANRVTTLENVQDARTAVDVAAAALRMAEFNQRFAVITAPAAGQILRRQGEPNELVGPGRPILVFASAAEGWLVRAGLADRDVARVAIGDRAEILVGGPEVKALTGRLAHVSEAADAGTRTTPVEIVLDAIPERVRSGQVVTAVIAPARVAPRAVVPVAALVEGVGAKASLFVVEAGAATARRLVVEVEALHGADAYLRTALPRTARIVVSGGEYLRDGMPVEASP